MLDAEERVSGRVNYVLNFELPGMLTGKILRSPLPHARLVTVDGSRAERLAGASAEALQLAAALPGPYRIRHYAWEVLAVCTNKTTLSVYRGVGLPPAV